MFSDDPDVLKKVISCDESWVYGYDIETKAQPSQWKRLEEPRRKENFKHKQRRMDIAQEMSIMFNDNPDLLKKVITCDESCVYGYDIETIEPNRSV